MPKLGSLGFHVYVRNTRQSSPSAILDGCSGGLHTQRFRCIRQETASWRIIIRIKLGTAKNSPVRIVGKSLENLLETHTVGGANSSEMTTRKPKKRRPYWGVFGQWRNARKDSQSMKITTSSMCQNVHQELHQATYKYYCSWPNRTGWLTYHRREVNRQRRSRVIWRNAGTIFFTSNSNVIHS